VQAGAQNGSTFALKNLHFKVLDASFVGLTVTITGYLGGSPVSGATYTTAAIGATNTDYTIDVSTNPAFAGIDNFYISLSSVSKAIGTFSIEDITISAPTILPVVWAGLVTALLDNGHPPELRIVFLLRHIGDLVWQ